MYLGTCLLTFYWSTLLHIPPVWQVAVMHLSVSCHPPLGKQEEEELPEMQ